MNVKVFLLLHLCEHVILDVNCDNILTYMSFTAEMDLSFCKLYLLPHSAILNSLFE